MKGIGIKIIENSKYQNGYGEGVCLVLTQLLDKYLINQNFIFKKPIFFTEETQEQMQNDFEEVILEDPNITNNNHKNNQNFNYNSSNTNNFYAKNNSAKVNPNNTTSYNTHSATKRFNSGKSSTTQGILFFCDFN